MQYVGRALVRLRHNLAAAYLGRSLFWHGPLHCAFAKAQADMPKTASMIFCVRIQTLSNLYHCRPFRHCSSDITCHGYCSYFPVWTSIRKPQQVPKDENHLSEEEKVAPRVCGRVQTTCHFGVSCCQASASYPQTFSDTDAEALTSRCPLKMKSTPESPNMQGKEGLLKKGVKFQMKGGYYEGRIARPCNL